MTTATLVIATPHPRYDLLEQRVRERLPDWRIVRLREKHELAPENLASIGPEFVFLPHWSWLIPQEVHSQFNCVIFHMTDLPYGRGGSPLQNLIVRGHRETQLSALQCAPQLDAGPVFLKRPLSLAGTAEDILQRAAALMADMILDIVTNRPVPVPQKGDVVTFKRRGPLDGNLMLANSIEQVYDFIRMLDADGYPPAFIEVGGLRLEFSNARQADHESLEATVRIRRTQNE